MASYNHVYEWTDLTPAQTDLVRDAAGIYGRGHLGYEECLYALLTAISGGYVEGLNLMMGRRGDMPRVRAVLTPELLAELAGLPGSNGYHCAVRARLAADNQAAMQAA